jgi:hypothetical protein
VNALMCVYACVCVDACVYACMHMRACVCMGMHANGVFLHVSVRKRVRMRFVMHLRTHGCMHNLYVSAGAYV